jgi:hypothetical protein
MIWTVEFRHFSSWEEGIPLMYVPKQGTGIEAEDVADARMKFFESWSPMPPGRFEILDIYPSSIQKEEARNDT